MIIAIDYDNTYTADPDTFNKVIELFKAAGHDVICVTAREDGVMGVPVRNSIGKLVPVIFTGSLAKRVVAKKRGYDVDVWIDDMPAMIDEYDSEELERRAQIAMHTLNTLESHKDKIKPGFLIKEGTRSYVSDTDYKKR